MSLIDLASMVLAPTAVKDGKVYNAIPNDQDFTFSRGTEATRVNSAGLIEKARTNFLLQSNTFDTTWFAGGTISVTGGQSGYDSSSNAWLLDKTQANAHWRQNFTFDGSIVTYSLYVKAGSLNWVNLNYATTNSFFDLENGVVGVTTAINSTIEDIGGGWYRCSAINNYSGGSSVRIYPADDDNDTSGTSGNILIQDAQLEQGLVSTDVITTTTSSVTVGITDDLPRVDYSGGGCPSLLLEPSRTQLLTQSEYFDDWTKSGSGTITVNYATSPEGLKNAYRYQAPSGSRYVVYKNIGVSNGVTYTLSLYAKSLSGTQKIRIGADNGCVNPQGAETFDIGTEWVRVETQITSTQSSWNIYFDNVESGTTCTGTYLSADLLIYGFQVEAGSYVSSYIPSYGTSTSRSADSCSKTGISDLIGQTEGVIYMNVGIVHNNSVTGASKWFFEVRKDDTNSFGIGSGGADSAPAIRFVTQISGSYSTDAEPQNFSNSKIAVKYNASNFKIFQNGVLKNTIAKSIGDYADIQFMEGAGLDLSMPLKEFIVFPTALSDDECIALTK